MGNFSKIRALASAFALSVMFMTSTTAQAAQSHDYSYTRSSSVIDSNYNQTKVSASAPCYDKNGKALKYARNTAFINAWTIGVQKGFAKVGNPSDYATYYYVTNPGSNELIFSYFALNNGYRYSTDYEETGTGKDKIVTAYVTFYKTVYKNNITGETSTERSDLTGTRIYKGDNEIPEKEMVYKGDYSDIDVYLGSGNVKIKNLKSSNKKVVQATSFVDSSVKTSDCYAIHKDSKGYYYYPDYGQSVKYINNPDAKINRSHAHVIIRVFGKKSGKAVISFDIVNKDGKKTGSAKVTVVSTTSEPLASVTLGGKSLDQGNTVGSAKSNYIYNNKNLNAFYKYTTMKKGVLKVTPNKDYKLVRIQVGHLEKYKYDTKNEPDYGDKNYSTADVTKTDRKSVETTRYHHVDLNGDGDYDDVVNGIDEDSVLYRYKTVKNKSKITLSKTPSYTKTTTRNSTTYHNSNATENTSTVKYDNNKGYCLTAPTSIRITLYNKIAKQYEDVTYTVWKKIK